jgi:hypothetical protein
VTKSRYWQNMPDLTRIMCLEEDLENERRENHRLRERIDELTNDIIILKTLQASNKFQPIRGTPADTVNDPLWAERHLNTCGTAFRGCDPECPKELAERLREK